MLGTVLKKVFGSANERRLKAYRPKIAEINALEPQFQALTDEQLRDKTAEFRAALAAGKTPRRPAARPPSPPSARPPSARSQQRHFDVQLIGGMVLHEGAIAEMRTGEGKTLVATCRSISTRSPGAASTSSPSTTISPAATPAWMGRIYKFLGLTVGVIVHGLDDEERRQAYACDITYGTNNEFGFDYLRDNMKYEMGHMVQRGHAFAIVDEVDSILVDEARTPLIISGPSEDRSGLYAAVDTMIPRLVREDYDIDEKQRTVNLTEAGNEHAEAMLRGNGRPEGGLALRGRERDAGASRQPGAARAQAVLARQGLHRPQRRGRHHRRVHRPHDAGPALFGRVASGARSQGASDRPAGERHARLDHLPELFPPLREARRHDRHRLDRG